MLATLRWGRRVLPVLLCKQHIMHGTHGSLVGLRAQTFHYWALVSAALNGPDLLEIEQTSREWNVLGSALQTQVFWQVKSAEMTYLLWARITAFFNFSEKCRGCDSFRMLAKLTHHWEKWTGDRETILLLSFSSSSPQHCVWSIFQISLKRFER